MIVIYICVCMCVICVCIYTRTVYIYIYICVCVYNTRTCMYIYTTAHPPHPTHTTNPQPPQELPNWQPIMDRIRRGEQRIARNKEIRALLDEKVSPHKNPWLTLKINYGPQVRRV